MPVFAHIGSTTSVVVWLTVASVAYGLGVRRIWTASGVGRGVSKSQVALFVAGIGSLLIALTGPVERIAEDLFSAHMSQHVILIFMASPLLVMSRPLLPLARMLSPRGRRRLGRIQRVSTGGRDAWRPVVAWGLSLLFVFWIWHVPFVYDAAVDSQLLHVTQHVSLLAVSLGLWWVLATAVPRRVAGVALAMLGLLFIQGAWLTAFFLFSGTAHYEAFVETSARWDLTPLEDEQIGWSVMGLSGLVWVGAIVTLLARFVGVEEPIQASVSKRS